MSASTLAVPTQGIVGLDGAPITGRAPWFTDEQDVKNFLFENLGPLDDIDLFFNDVLVAKYIREEIGAGLIAAPETQREDSWQGVVGLVLKLGPRAFENDERNNFYGVKPEVGDWVLYRNSDGWDKDIAYLSSRTTFAKCRIIQDVHIRGRVKYPGRLL